MPINDKPLTELFPWAVPGADVVIIRGASMFRTKIERVTKTRVVTPNGYSFYCRKHGRAELKEVGVDPYASYAGELVAADDPQVAAKEHWDALNKSIRTARNAAHEFTRGVAGELETRRLIKALEDHLEEMKIHHAD